MQKTKKPPEGGWEAQIGVSGWGLGGWPWDRVLYVGWFTSMRTGSEALGTSLRDAHVRGELWTVARDNLVYVFRCPPVGSP